MKKPISLWITQAIFIISIVLLTYFFATLIPSLFNIYKLDLKIENAGQLYLSIMIRLLVLIAQVMALYLSFKQKKLARLFTLLGWLPVLAVILLTSFSDGFTTVSDGFFSYDNEAQRLGGLLSKYIQAGLFIWLTAILLFSKKIKHYFQFNKSC